MFLLWHAYMYIHINRTAKNLPHQADGIYMLMHAMQYVYPCACSRFRTLTLLNTPLINSNNNQNTDIVDFPAAVMVEWVIPLILLGEGAVATEIKTGDFGVAGDGGG